MYEGSSAHLRRGCDDWQRSSVQCGEELGPERGLEHPEGALEKRLGAGGDGERGQVYRRDRRGGLVLRLEARRGADRDAVLRDGGCGHSARTSGGVGTIVAYRQ